MHGRCRRPSFRTAPAAGWTELGHLYGDIPCQHLGHVASASSLPREHQGTEPALPGTQMPRTNVPCIPLPGPETTAPSQMLRSMSTCPLTSQCPGRSLDGQALGLLPTPHVLRCPCVLSHQRGPALPTRLPGARPPWAPSAQAPTKTDPPGLVSLHAVTPCTC